MAQMQLKIVTPEKEIFSELVDMVTVPSADGELGILPHHVALMAKVVPGELRIHKGGRTQYLAVGEGFMQIANNTLTVLTDLAQDSSDIDERAVLDAKKRAELALEQKLSNEEYADTLAILEKSLAQLKVRRRHNR